MPCFAYGLPAAECRVREKLRSVPDSVCHGCYAFNRGNYQFSSVQMVQYKRLGSITHRLWVDALVYMIQHGMRKDPARAGFFRWHDSGDVQDLFHLVPYCGDCGKTSECMLLATDQRKGCGTLLPSRIRCISFQSNGAIIRRYDRRART